MKQIIRKILFYLFTAWAALTINFIVPRLMPGDPKYADRKSVV